MPSLRPAALLRRMAERPSSAAIFLHGPEAFLRERAVQSIVEGFLDPATKDFNLDQIRGGEADAESLASIVATPPMMAEYRVVVLRDAQGLGTRAREVVEQIVEAPPAGLILVVVATVPGGSRAKFYDTLKAAALSVEFPPIHADDLPGWIIEHGSVEHGIEVEIDAARAWAAAIGPELGVLATEMEKAAAYIGDRRRITLEDVKAIGGYIPRVDRWQWLDLVGERKFVNALDQVPELLDSGETAVGLVVALGNHLIRLGMAAAGGPEALERNLGSQQRWLIRKLGTQALLWSIDQVDRGISDLLRTDGLLKSASLTNRQAVEELLLRLANDATEQPPGPTARAAGALENV